jgi:hypothetical protein
MVGIAASGAFMAMQMHVSYSQTINGAAMIGEKSARPVRAVVDSK